MEVTRSGSSSNATAWQHAAAHKSNSLGGSNAPQLQRHQVHPGPPTHKATGSFGGRPPSGKKHLTSSSSGGLDLGSTSDTDDDALANSFAHKLGLNTSKHSLPGPPVPGPKRHADGDKPPPIAARPEKTKSIVCEICVPCFRILFL